MKEFSPVNINGKKLEFQDNAEHVGIIRSTSGNMPNLLKRISSHKKAVAAVLSNGLAKHHRGNIAACLKVEQIYGSQVLLSGIGALKLTKTEVGIIEQHNLETLRKCMKLIDGTPKPVVYFLAGRLPGTAMIHLKQLSLFGMITRKNDSILRIHALNVYCQATYSWSWFSQIRDICMMYQLDHPLAYLNSPMAKQAHKKLVKCKVLD